MILSTYKHIITCVWGIRPRLSRPYVHLMFTVDWFIFALWLESLLCMSVHDPPHSIHGPQTPNTQLKLSKSCTEPQSRLLFPSGLAAVVQALILQPFDLMLISKIYLKGVLMWCEWTLTRCVKVASNAGRHTPLFKHRYSHYAFSIPVSRDELV